MKRRIQQALLLVSLLGLLLSACSNASPTPESVVETPQAVQETPSVEQQAVLQTEAPVYPAETALPAEVPVEEYPMPVGDPAELAYPALEQATAGQESVYVPPARVEEPAAAAPTQASAPTAAPTRQPRVDFVATDPKTVQLAAGKVQLIEFFAFW